jgi:DNA-binding transcriptional MerR regulator
MDSKLLYTIGTVSRLTKISQDTLRVWERRYDLGATQKTASGRRQYTQNELEHLQIISALLDRGYKIGEIAAMERKTLDALQSSDLMATRPYAAPTRTHLLVVGKELCDWLNENQSCLVRLKATFIIEELQDFDGQDLLKLQPVDLLMVSAESPSERDSQRMSELRSMIGSPPTLVCHTAGTASGNSGNDDILLAKGPMTVEAFAASVKCLMAKAELRAGDSGLTRLGKPKSRLFSNQALDDIRQSPASIACDCPSHLSELIESLSAFEAYSSECAVENWSDAATHACVYAYANQARWLIEKALATVVADHQSSMAESSGSNSEPV